MDDEFLSERLQAVDAILIKSLQSSDERLERVNGMVERLVQQTQTVNEMANRISDTYERMLERENERNTALVSFLECMRDTYDTHIKSLEESRNRAASALLSEQKLTQLLLEKLSPLVSISGVGNITQK